MQPVQTLFDTLKVALKRHDRLPPLVHAELLGREVIVRAGAVREQADYDDAWLFACSLHAESVLDVGANKGQSALVILLSSSVKCLILVEANPTALAIAAENLIRNHLADKVRFVPAFAGDTSHEIVEFFTVGAGQAGSMYPDHARSASRAGISIQTPVVTVDSICARYGIVPDLIKIDVEGAEFKVLSGSQECAGPRRTRFLVEMHSNSELTMEANGVSVLSWRDSMAYKAWYLKEAIELTTPEPIQSRGRCHLLLQPRDWAYPDWLTDIRQSDPLMSVALP